MKFLRLIIDMSLLFDVIIIAVCIVTIVIGAKRGFVKSVMCLCSNIASFVLSWAFYPKLSLYIKNNWLQKALSDGIASTIKALSSSGAGGNTVTYDLSRLFTDMPEAFTRILNRYNTNFPELQTVYGNASNVVESTVDSLASAISSPVASMLSNTAAFAVIYFSAIFALMVISLILDLIFKLPILKTANTFLGALFGIICAVMLAWILGSLSICLINAMSSVRPDSFNGTVIQNSVILKFFYENNILTMFTLSD